ncbi:MAG: chemotaxis protein CheW [Deltaproteobacteria bacterium]|nr:chemotaxis protein CheW [Deltaproteobacteria bacterium]
MKENQSKKNYESPPPPDGAEPPKKGHEQRHKVFPFLLGTKEYAFEAGDAPEVLKAMPVTEVPSTPAFIKGIIPFRGEMLAVIDLRNRLGMEGAAQKSKMLIAGADDLRAAFLVDAVAGVCEADTHPPDATEEKDVFVKGIIKSQGRVIRVLSLEKLLNISISMPPCPPP